MFTSVTPKVYLQKLKHLMARKQFLNTERLIKKTNMKASTSHGRIISIYLELKFYVFTANAQIQKFLNKNQEIKS